MQCARLAFMHSVLIRYTRCSLKVKIGNFKLWMSRNWVLVFKLAWNSFGVDKKTCRNSRDPEADSWPQWHSYQSHITQYQHLLGWERVGLTGGPEPNGPGDAQVRWVKRPGCKTVGRGGTRGRTTQLPGTRTSKKQRSCRSRVAHRCELTIFVNLILIVFRS